PPPAPATTSAIVSPSPTPLLLFGTGPQFGAVAAPSRFAGAVDSSFTLRPALALPASTLPDASTRYTPATFAIEPDLAAADESFATGDWSDSLALGEISPDGFDLSPGGDASGSDAAGDAATDAGVE